MATTRTLLDRIAEARDPAEGPAHPPPNRMDDIGRAVEALLNSRPRGCTAAPGYGVATLAAGGCAGPAAAEEVARDVQRAIARYEPRLAEVRVRVAIEPSAPFAYVFRIEARLPSMDGGGRARFTSVLNARGEVRVLPEEGVR